MHDIDRTVTEFESDLDEYEAEYDEYEAEYEDEYEYAEGVFDEAEEMELAAELLSTSDEYELDQFLGKLFKKVGRKVKKFAKSATSGSLGSIIKGAAKKALPIVGGALGTVVGGPVGTALGSKLASGAGNMFGLELEGLSPEDQEFEVARRVVRFAGEAAKNAAEISPAVEPRTAAKAAAVAAAKKHAPGLLRPQPRMPSGIGAARSGRWLRRGAKIVLMGV
jgi:uncharacterized protein (DUF697 family)